MTDHADIVRNESAWLADYADYGARATEDQGGFVDGDADSHRANLIAALVALVAERDESERLRKPLIVALAQAEAEVARLREALTAYVEDDCRELADGEGLTTEETRLTYSPRYRWGRAALGEDA